MKINETPVLLLTGYLGSGKTTLVNHILTNKHGIKFAVIVNDIGEINIDSELIEKGGVVGKKDESLLSLQNGCICCTLKMDLVEQLNDITKTKRFDYIVIEASGICEPAPIAQTICSIPNLGPEYQTDGFCRLDNIVTVVDALRLKDEFSDGADLTRSNIEEEDIENLIIQQIEFCNVILLNKISEVSKEEEERIKQIIRAIQPKAKIIECDYANVDINTLINTNNFDFDEVAGSAAWIQEIEKPLDELEEDEHHHECHEHHHDEHEEHEHHHGHHHHHDHEHGETEEYGIQTFVYYRRPAFDITEFDQFISRKWSKNIIRAKGICYFNSDRDMSFIFEQAGSQKKLSEAGLWFAAATEEDMEMLMRQNPDMMRDWDERYGDRMQKIVFIGQHLDKEQLTKDLDACLEE